MTSGHDQTPQLHVQGRRNGAEQSGALPALVYKSALDVTRDAAAALEKIFKDNGWGRDQWRDGIYPFVHYHAMLGIARGCSRVQLGGHQGETLEFADVAVLPADTGHGFSAARTSWSSAPIRRRVPIISATATIRRARQGAGRDSKGAGAAERSSVRQGRPATNALAWRMRPRARKEAA